jgi:serine/threonine protein kinase
VQSSIEIVASRQNSLPLHLQNSLPLQLQNSLPLQPLDVTVSGAIARRERRGKPQLFGVGEILNGVYEIRRLIGRGGMGQVFEAHDHVLDRVVAIKVANPGGRSGRLLREARALAALRGQGVPSVFAMGNWQDLEYCVMERVFGTTLSRHIMQRIPQRLFSVSEVVEILEGVAQALVRVHRAGMIHRDLKPENIMLVPQSRVVLIDFGLFRTEGHPWDESGIWGSPRYIAPETITHNVCLGEEHLVDIYSLGIIAFFLLIGCPPFNSKSVSSILTKHMEQIAPRISSMRADVPEELDQLVQDMLAKEPTDRPSSAKEVVVRLRSLADC